jgi:tetratricopeptide (TPR) repeat protein
LRRTPTYIAEANAALGHWSDAIAVLRPVEAREAGVRGLLGFALARSGARADAQRLLNQMLADEGAGLAPAYGIAEVYIGLGDYDRAFVWLDRAFDDYSLNPRIMGPLFRDFRADPRFERVRRRLGRVGPQHP